VTVGSTGVLICGQVGELQAVGDRVHRVHAGQQPGEPRRANVAAGFAVGYVRAPRLTRLLAGMYTMYAISDGLQFAYLAADEHAG